MANNFNVLDGQLSGLTTVGEQQSLAAVTATGAGTAISVDGKAHYAIRCTHTGAPAVVLVNLEGTSDGTNYFTLGAWASAGGQVSGDVVFVTGKPVAKVRANLATLTGGTNPTVSAWIRVA